MLHKFKNLLLKDKHIELADHEHIKYYHQEKRNLCLELVLNTI